jgi:hypothetical protein
MATYQDYNPINSPVAQRPTWYDSPRNGGGRTIDSTLPPNKFYGTSVPKVRNAHIAHRQVLKAGTFLIENDYGDLIAAKNIAETALVTLNAPLKVGQTLTIAGLTFTATVGGASIAQLMDAWSPTYFKLGFTQVTYLDKNSSVTGTGTATFTTGSKTVTFSIAHTLPEGTVILDTSGNTVGIFASDVSGTTGTLVTNAEADTFTTTVAQNFRYIKPTIEWGGAFTSGTLDVYRMDVVDANTLSLVTLPANTNVGNITVASTGTAPTLVIQDGGGYIKPVAVLMYDVDATSGVKACQVYYEACFWADDLTNNPSFLRWVTDPSETVYNAATGLNVACTAYNTGCFGMGTYITNLKQMYVSGTEFEIYISPPVSDVYDPNNNVYVGV